jgi:integrase
MRGLWLRGETWWFAGTLPGFGRIRCPLKTKDAAVAITKAQLLRADPIKYLGGQSSTPALDSYFDHLRRQGISEGYRQVNAAALAKALRVMGSEDPRHVTHARLRKWLDAEIDAGRAPNAVQVFGRLRRLFRWLVLERRMPADPSEGISVPKVAPRLRRRFLTREQADMVLERCGEPGLRFALYCALHAGMRKGEIVASRPDWFDLKAGLLHIQNTDDFLIKDRDDRTVPLTAEFLEFLTGYGLRSPYMLESTKPHLKGKRKGRYRYDFRRPFTDHMKACGLEDFTFHDLRRTFASLLVSSGVSVYKVGKWLGDGVAVVEKRYGHLIAADEDINRAWRQRAITPPP